MQNRSIFTSAFRLSKTLFHLKVIWKNNGKWEPNNIGATDFQYMENRIEMLFYVPQKTESHTVKEKRVSDRLYIFV